MEMAQLQQSAVHNHTAAMLEMGTNLLSQTAEQTRKLTDVETQVMTPPCCDDDNGASFRSAFGFGGNEGLKEVVGNLCVETN